jgi:molecular chaperone GrpE
MNERARTEEPGSVEMRPPDQVLAQEELPPPDTAPPAPWDDVSAPEANPHEQLQRLQADFANFRRRVADSAGRAAHHRAVDIATLLLPVIDNFERALVAETTDAAYAEGVRLTYRHLINTLAGIGLEPIVAMGRPFDPHVHEALRRIETDAVPDGTVVEELRRGYRLGDTLLRPAQVSVAAAPRGV